MSDLLIGIAISLLKTLGLLFAVILPMVSYTVYAERRVSAMIQDRVGPNRVGPLDHGAGRSSFWQHVVWPADGSRQCRRRCALGVRRFIARGVWNCFGRLVFQFQVFLSRRYSLELPNDFV